MAYTPGIQKETRIVMIAAAAVGASAAVIAAARLLSTYRIDLRSSSFSSSLTGAWIAVQIIIVVVWKLSDDGNRRKPQNHNPAQHKERNLEILPALPMERKPSSEFWREIPELVPKTSGISPESESILCDSVPKSVDPSPPPPPVEIEPDEKESIVSPRDGIEKTEATTEAEVEHESIDATWRAIMDGGATPARRFLRKSDTWERPPKLEAPAIAPLQPEMRKSATFQESPAVAAEMRLRGREAVGHADELHGRAENFIKMHYDHLRLQREESEHRRSLEIANHAY